MDGEISTAKTTTHGDARARPGAVIVREKRLYNKWVASQSLEDYALRFTAEKARKWSAETVAATAIGSSAFLACEALGASITIMFGFANAVAAIISACVLMFIIGAPIAYHAARHGLDIDLLTRGAGFGYLGSTLTSLIYAAFTFFLLAVEASIMSTALQVLFELPLFWGNLIGAVAVVPIAIFGMSGIARFQVWSQPIWILLQLLPIFYLLTLDGDVLSGWKLESIPREIGGAGEFGLIAFGLAFSTILSLLPQIGEQADYLRFMPAKEKTGRVKWWTCVLLSGPGWTLIGGAKLLLGAVLAVYLINTGMDAESVVSPANMFERVFTQIFDDGRVGLLAAGLFVIVCQFKINVTNAYAGSIAWSNFFSRLTHSHPGRVVWLVFNVLLAFLLMQAGIFSAIEWILVVLAMPAAGWIGALVGDLVVSRPLGLAPRTVEFKRAHLFDINPVGVGAMLASVIVSAIAYTGLLGAVPQAFAPFLGLVTSFLLAPALAWATKGRFYQARQGGLADEDGLHECQICENVFEHRDMAYCPMYKAPICSLCCTLEVRCNDMCKQNSRAADQANALLTKFVPASALSFLWSAVGEFLLIMCAATISMSLLLYGIYWFASIEAGRPLSDDVKHVLVAIHVVFTIISGVAAWFITLAHKSRRAAFRESSAQTEKLYEEIAAHEQTDMMLQSAKKEAEDANDAKSRFLVSVSHEVRAPLNSIFGYAQLLERGSSVDARYAGKVIRRSSEHLGNLVEGLMEISRVEGGVIKLERKAIRFHTFLMQIANMMRPQAQAKGLHFNLSIADGVPEVVKADPNRLRQILINIIANAIKFTSTGKVDFQVYYRNEIADFRIVDTGPGIASEDQERIFGAFQRGSPATNAPGIGLGLAITRVLTHIMGGDISLESEPGEGCAFRVRIMLPRCTEADIVISDIEDRPDTIGAGLNVLVIDDDVNQVAIVEELLTSHGYNVDVFNDVASGVEFARRVRPDFAVLDVNMPGESGWDAASRLRAQFGNSIVIIMISADARSAKEHDPTRDLHNAFIPKPFDFNDLLDELNKNHVLAGEDADPGAGGAKTSVEAVSHQAPETKFGPVNVTAQRQLLSQLVDCATSGNVSKIKRILRQLDDAQLLPLESLEYLEECAMALDLKGILKWVSEYHVS